MSSPYLLRALEKLGVAIVKGLSFLFIDLYFLGKLFIDEFLYGQLLPQLGFQSFFRDFHLQQRGLEFFLTGKSLFEHLILFIESLVVNNESHPLALLVKEFPVDKYFEDPLFYLLEFILADALASPGELPLVVDRSCRL